MAIQPSKRRKPITTSMLLMAAGLFVITPLQAEEVLPTVVVTAGRIAEDPARISADVTVINEEQIKKAQAITIAELLRHQVGLNIVSTGGAGKTTSLFMRGGNSGHTLVLVDGVRVGSGSTGAFDWSLISPEDIERIEIVRGPQSSLYGADAMSGVVQVFTKTGEGKAKVRINGEAGGLASSRGSMQVSGSTENGINYALTASGQRTAGISAVAAGTEKDPFRQTQLSGRGKMPIGAGDLAFTVRQSEGRTGIDGWGVDALNYISKSRQSIYSTKLTYPLMESWESNFQLSRSTDDSINSNPANAFNNSEIRTIIDQLSWQNIIETENISLLFGFDHHTNRVIVSSGIGSVSPSSYNKELRQNAAFLSLSWHSDMLDLNGSARHDRNSSYGNKTTWHTGVALHPLQGLKISANYGTGFKAPSMNQLYWPGFGNPDLKPETSKGWDAGIRYDWDDHAIKAGLGATWFDQSVKDLIAGAPPTWLPSNINKAHNRGLELSGKLSFAGAYLQANWNYLLARDTGNETWLARRPKESGNILLGIDIGPLNLEGNLAIVGPRFSDPNNVTYMKGYRKTDLRARYKINPAWELTARVDNAENKKYEEAAGYGVPGRVWYAGAGATF